MNLLIRNTLIAVTILALWAWVAADDWAHELELERSEQQRVQSIRQYELSKRADRTGEDWVDTTPLPVAEPEPTYISAPLKRTKQAVVRTKQQIKKSVNTAR